MWVVQVMTFGISGIDTIETYHDSLVTADRVASAEVLVQLCLMGFDRPDNYYYPTYESFVRNHKNQNYSMVLSSFNNWLPTVNDANSLVKISVFEKAGAYMQVEPCSEVCSECGGTGEIDLGFYSRKCGCQLKA